MPLVMATDARITKVGVCHGMGEPKITVIPSTDIPCLLRAEVNIGGTPFEMIDYGSAGKTWTEASLTEAWIKI